MVFYLENHCLKWVEWAVETNSPSLLLQWYF